MDIFISYPETRHYKWDLLPHARVLEASKHDDDPKAFSWLKLVTQYIKSAKPHTPQHATWLDVRKHLVDMVKAEQQPPLTYDEGLGTWVMKASNFRKLLTACAQHNKWSGRTSTRAGFTAKVEGRPDLRRCSKCSAERPVQEFRAHASDKRKIKYGWGKNDNPTHAIRYYTHHLCAECRYARSSKPERIKSSPELAELRKQMNAVYVKSHAFVREVEGQRPVGWVDGVYLDSAYYFHKARAKAVENARAKLLAWINDKPLPKLWSDLLSPTERVKVQELFNQHIAPYYRRGKPPKCF